MSSERTKRRKIAAGVAKIVSSTLNEQPNVPIAVVSSLNVNDRSSTSKALTNECYDVELQENFRSQQLPSQCSDDSQQFDDSLNCLDVVSPIDENAGLEFYDCIDWVARETDYGDDFEDKATAIKEYSLSDKLRQWSVEFQISQRALDSLLSTLREHSHADELPADARTLQGTKRTIDTKIVAGGEYVYIGLAYWLTFFLSSLVLPANISQLTINLNIDGIPLFKSASTSLWPILGSIDEILNSKVFPIALGMLVTSR